jgi:hypothetical protein
LIDQPAVQAWLQSRHESFESSAGPPGVAENIESSETPENVDGVPDA